MLRTITAYRNGLLTLVAAVLFIAVALAAQPALALNCQVSPDAIPIDLMYHGTTVTVTGDSAPDDDLIVKVSSKAGDIHLKYKGKAGGIFWMKMGGMEFKNVPNVYMLFTTSPVNSILPPQERTANVIGYDAIQARSEVERSDGKEVGPEWFQEFLKFKKKENLYSINEGTIVRQHGTTGNQFKLEIPWPFQAPPETYTVEVLAVRDGKVVYQASAPVTVAQSGIVKQLSGLAFNNPAIYGVIAVVVAMAAGFAVGAIFKKGGGSH